MRHILKLPTQGLHARFTPIKIVTYGNREHNSTREFVTRIILLKLNIKKRILVIVSLVQWVWPWHELQVHEGRCYGETFAVGLKILLTLRCIFRGEGVYARKMLVRHVPHGLRKCITCDGTHYRLPLARYRADYEPILM